MLAIETSNPFLSVAVKKKGCPIREASLEGYFRHAENLIPLIDQLLTKEKISSADIHTFLIGRGPGSFTGLRIGFATLKGFLNIKKRDCYGALSLDMIAEGISLPEKSILAVCLDARRGKIFTRSYRRTQGIWETLGELKVLTSEEVIKQLSPGAYAAGDALLRYREDFNGAGAKKKLKFLPESQWYPKASALIRMVQEKKYTRGSSRLLVPLKKPKDFIPFYQRLSEAEEKKTRK